MLDNKIHLRVNKKMMERQLCWVSLFNNFCTKIQHKKYWVISVLFWILLGDSCELGCFAVQHCDGEVCDRSSRVSTTAGFPLLIVVLWQTETFLYSSSNHDKYIMSYPIYLENLIWFWPNRKILHENLHFFHFDYTFSARTFYQTEQIAFYLAW